MNICKNMLVGGMSVICTLAAQSKPAPELVCGAVVTTALKLQADLGPCPGDGLSINSARSAVTIDLNGHRLLGSGVGAGLKIGTSNGGITVIGPGTIRGFETGIGIQDDSVLIFDVTLRNNQVGISILGSKSVRVVSNTISGEGSGVTGIVTGDAGNIFLYHNRVEGHSGAGINLSGETDAVVDENTITDNKTGITTGPADLVCFKLRGNHIDHNAGNGIDANPAAGTNRRAAISTVGSCFAIEDNVVNANGGHGIALEKSGALSQVSIQDNIVRKNKKNGINLIGGHNSEVIGNVILNNGVADLFWDAANSPNSCQQQNIYGTTAGSKLPTCP